MHKECCDPARVLVSQHLSACTATHRAISGFRGNQSLFMVQHDRIAHLKRYCTSAHPPSRLGNDLTADKGMDQSWPRPFRQNPTQLQW